VLKNVDCVGISIVEAKFDENVELKLNGYDTIVNVLVIIVVYGGYISILDVNDELKSYGKLMPVNELTILELNIVSYILRVEVNDDVNDEI